MSNGFALTLTDGVAEMRVHGPEAGRGLVTSAQQAGIGLALYGRLYYRDELAAAIGTDAAATADDAVLALASYRRFGIAGIERLEGDFALVVVDAGEQRIIANRDPMGGYPLYWTQSGRTLGIATSPRPLDGLHGGAAPDIAFLGEIQMMPFFEIDHLDRTAFEGVHRLVPGTLLIASMQTGAVEVRRFWDWADRIAGHASDDLDSAAERYRELLDRAVAERSRGTVASHLSGGMDSTSVALLAHQHLAGRDQPLHAVTIVYDKLFGLASEAPYIAAVADRPGLISHRFPGDEILDFDHFGASPLYDEPYSGFFRLPLSQALVDVALDAGADTALTGLGADELAGDMPFYIADELRRGRMLTAWREAARWAKAGSRSPWHTFRPFALDPLMPVWLRPGLRAALNGGRANFTRRTAWTIPSWVLDDFAHRGRLKDCMLNKWRRMTRSADSVVLSNSLATIANTSGDWVRATLAAPRGLHIAHPFRDPRLMVHALGARLRVRPVPGEQKALLGRAMRDVLPDAIVKRRDKGNFNAVYFQGLSRNLPRLERLVETSEAEAMGLFDKAQLIDCLRQGALGVDGVQRVHGLNNSLAILHWLAQLPAWRAAPDPSAPLFGAKAGGGVTPAVPGDGR